MVEHTWRYRVMIWLITRGLCPHALTQRLPWARVRQLGSTLCRRLEDWGWQGWSG